MRSFTSSFDRIKKIRLIPGHNWGKVSLLMVGLTVTILIAWEMRVRAMGYGPSINDTPGHWAIMRDKLDSHPDAIVVIGASRIRFGLDHDTVSQAFGGRKVINLAINGAGARPILSHLANDKNFSGTILCGYTPSLFWAPGGPPLNKTMDWLNAYHNRTPSEFVGQRLVMVPESRIAFLEAEDLRFHNMIRSLIPLQNRGGVQIPPRFPPYFGEILADRQQVMWKKMETDPDLQQKVQEIWRALFSGAPPLPPPLLESLRGEVIEDVAKITARGGEVIFIRYPSTGWLREFERETSPRETHWDPLVEQTGSIGIHYKDFPELSGYDCPEWSHLTGPDALQFTRDLMTILQAKRSR
ncbi:MAG: hypothetical protein JJU11_16800 [Candidatus Sumerlaeia bacterium]|nr:hypothetical protein [Candidatus Sumerlaeia bacterium]